MNRTSLPTTDPADGRTSLYRYYDENGVLLYVGITGRGLSRNVEHNKSKPWWSNVRRQEVDHYPDRARALAAERAAIRQYRPPYNIQHNPGHAVIRAAYEAFVAAQDVTAEEMRILCRRLPLDVVHIGNGTMTLATRKIHLDITRRIVTNPPYPGMAATPEHHSGAGVVRTLTKVAGIVLLDIAGQKLPRTVSDASAVLKAVEGQKSPKLRVSRVNINYPSEAT